MLSTNLQVMRGKIETKTYIHNKVMFNSAPHFGWFRAPSGGEGGLPTLTEKPKNPWSITVPRTIVGAVVRFISL